MCETSQLVDQSLLLKLEILVICNALHLLCNKLEADIFSGIAWDGKQNRYKSRYWDGTGENVSGSVRDRE